MKRTRGLVSNTLAAFCCFCVPVFWAGLAFVAFFLAGASDVFAAPGCFCVPDVLAILDFVDLLLDEPVFCEVSVPDARCFAFEAPFFFGLLFYNMHE